jgi:membrane associated rhomboid family serine protease
VLDEVITADRVRDLGMSPATGALFHGIALARAGDPERAEAALRRVESLAGPRDQRVIDASRTTLGRVMEATVDLEPELTNYVHGVASRLRRFLDAAPIARSRGPLWTTYGIMIGFAFAYGLWLLRDAGGIATLELGALTPELWRAGGWYRLFTAPWLHVDVITLMFDIYAVWLAGHMVEQVYGSARAALIGLGGAVVGLVAALLLTPYSMMAMAAGNLMVVSMIVAALWTLLPSRSPALSDRARRTLGVTLVLLFIANLLASLPSFLGLDYPPVALMAAGAWGTAMSLGLPAKLPRIVERGFAAIVVGALLVTGYAAGLLFGEDPEQGLLEARTQTCTFSGVQMQVPESFEWTRADLGEAGFAIPGLDGLTDMLAFQAGNLVQIGVLEAVGDDENPALVVAQPELARQFGITRAPADAPTGWPRTDADGPPPWQAWELRRNGEVVAQLVERPLPRDEDEVTVVMVASPGAALTHTPRLYAAIFEQAAYDPHSDGDGCPRDP